MRRALSAFVVIVLLSAGFFVYRTVDVCARWQDRYKQFVYSESMKNSPLILPEGGVEAIIGRRPTGCGEPPFELTNADMARYQSEGIGPNSFLEETRAAFKRS